MGERRLFHFRNPRETGHRIETLGEIAGRPRLCGPLPFQHPYLSSISNPVPRAHGPQLAPWKPELLWVHRLALRLTRLLSQQAEVITTAGAHKHRAESRRGRSHLHRPAANHPLSLSKPHLQNPPKKGRGREQCKGEILPPWVERHNEGPQNILHRTACAPNSSTQETGAGL